jgi:argininosuccinate synthase
MDSLYDEKIASFDANVAFEQKDAEGFIKLNALRLRLAERSSRKL